MTSNTEAFDTWIRGRFVTLNTELETLYSTQDNPAAVIGVGDDIKRAIEQEGAVHVAALLEEGNTDSGFDAAFDLLGSLGLYLAALRRHELTNPARETDSPYPAASALAMHIAASLGVAPRFATSHLTTHNRAIQGRYKTFTDLADERLFIDYNAFGILCFKRAADALRRIVPMGVSNPIARHLFEDAATALADVVRHNAALFDALDTRRFFYHVRPYYKPYRVGRQEYRGANAGDFAGINEIDLLLGLCQANDPSYAQILTDKMLFMMPDDQAQLRDCLRHQSLLDGFLDLVPAHAGAEWFRDNLAPFLRVCDLFGQTAAQHHDQLVAKFIAQPAADLPADAQAGLTASGPPLDVLLASLERLRDRRMAAARGDIRTRHADLARLRALL